MTDWGDLVFEPDKRPPDGGRRWKIAVGVLAGVVVIGSLCAWSVLTHPAQTSVTPSMTAPPVTVSVTQQITVSPTATPSPTPAPTVAPVVATEAPTTSTPPAPPVQAAPKTTNKAAANTTQAAPPVQAAPTTSKPVVVAVSKPSITVTSCTQDGRNVAATVSFDTGGNAGTVKISFGSVSAAPITVQATYTTATGSGVMPDTSPVTCLATISTSDGQDSASRAAD